MKKILKFIFITILLFLYILFSVSYYVKINTHKEIDPHFDKDFKADYIIVLGSAVYDGKPRPMLEERLKTAIDLYKKGYANKILMSGDNRVQDYNEVLVMKNYAIENGVDEEDIFLDGKGISTFDSMYRASIEYHIKSAIVVSQKYHLYRALYIGKHYDMDLYGVSAKYHDKSLQFQREAREIIARDKDFLKTMFTK